MEDPQVPATVPEPPTNGRNPDGTFAVGNPGGPGRPDGSVSIVEAIRRKLKEIPDGEQRTWLEKFLTTLFEEAIEKKNDKLIRDMIDRVDGKPDQKQTVEHTIPQNLIDALRNARTLKPGEYTVLPAKDPE